MLDNHIYDKIKIIGKLSCVAWFIDHHAIANAKKDKETVKALEALQKDLEKHIDRLQALLCK